MADKKISELTSIVGADTAADDFFVVVDTSGSATKKISRAELNNAIEQDVLAQVDITSANIDGGTIDNTPIGSTTASTGNFTTVDTTGNVTVGGNLTVQGTTVTVDTATVQTVDLGDNDKIRLGNSQDLQLYHSGSASFIDQVGNGSLLIRNTAPDADVLIYSDDGSGGEALYIQADGSNGRTRLYNYGSEKLSTRTDGIVITGTITADDNIVLSGASSPAITITDTTNTAVSVLKAGNVQGITGTTSNHDFFVRSNDTNRIGVAAAGDVSLYASDGTTQGFFWDASTQRLGLGTTSPRVINGGASVEGETSTGFEYLAGHSSNGLSGGEFIGGYLFSNRDTSGTDPHYAGMWADAADAFGYMDLHFSAGRGDYESSTSHLTIDKVGNVGIGTASPATDLDVAGNILTSDALYLNSLNVGSMAYFSYGGGNSKLWNTVNGALLFGTNNSEAMRIDSSQNFLVGKTSANLATAGVELSQIGQVKATRAGTVAYFNRTSTDGDIVEFRKDNTAVGSIGTDGGNLYIEGSTAASKTGIEFRGGTILPRDSGALTDGSTNLGSGGNRWQDLYLSGGVYLGGTGSANLLDDYEEGSFSPSLGAVSTSTNAGSANYVKIGDMVFCRGYIAWTGLDTGDGSAFQFTLPFAPNLTDDNASGNSAVQVSMNTKETTGLTGILADVLGARIVSSGIVALTGAETDITYNSGVDASGEFHFHISYRAT